MQERRAGACNRAKALGEVGGTTRRCSGGGAGFQKVIERRSTGRVMAEKQVQNMVCLSQWSYAIGAGFANPTCT